MMRPTTTEMSGVYLGKMGFGIYDTHQSKILYRNWIVFLRTLTSTVSELDLESQNLKGDVSRRYWFQYYSNNKAILVASELVVQSRCNVVGGNLI